MENQAVNTTPYKEHPVRGMFFAIAAFFLFAVMNMFAKLLAPYHSVFEIGFFRNIIALIPFVLIAVWKGKESIHVKKPKTVAIRAIIGTISLLVTFAAFIAMPMADVTAFLFTTSLMVPVLSVIFLKEHVGIYRWSAIAIGFIGVIIMVQPTGAVNTIGVTLALSAAFMHAFMGILLRYLGRTETPFAATFYFMLIGTLMTGLLMPFIGKVPAIEHWWMILGVGLSGAAAQFSLAAAFKNTQAAVVTIFNYSGIIWATAIGFLVWGDLPGLAIIIGGAIVVASNLFILWRERNLEKKLTAVAGHSACKSQ